MNEIKNLSFSEYGQLPYKEEKIAKILGYTFEREVFDFEKLINLRQDFFNDIEEEVWEKVKQLHNTTLARLKRISIDSETARREILISPILLFLFDEFNVQLYLEYPLNISDRLRGKLDYLIQATQSFIVIEAKNEDFERGAKQIIPELVALRQEQEVDSVYGVVTNGRVWQFYHLNYTKKLIEQDINLYVFPKQSELLIKILLAVCKKPHELFLQK